MLLIPLILVQFSNNCMQIKRTFYLPIKHLWFLCRFNYTALENMLAQFRGQVSQDVTEDWIITIVHHGFSRIYHMLNAVKRSNHNRRESDFTQKSVKPLLSAHSVRQAARQLDKPAELSIVITFACPVKPEACAKSHWKAPVQPLDS